MNRSIQREVLPILTVRGSEKVRTLLCGPLPRLIFRVLTIVLLDVEILPTTVTGINQPLNLPNLGF